MSDVFRKEPVRDDMVASARALRDAWVNIAEHATEIANARRVMFLAYVAEGFTEGQALELVRAA